MINGQNVEIVVVLCNRLVLYEWSKHTQPIICKYCTMRVYDFYFPKCLYINDWFMFYGVLDYLKKYFMICCLRSLIGNVIEIFENVKHLVIVKINNNLTHIELPFEGSQLVQCKLNTKFN